MATTDILISPATVHYAPLGEAFPDETTVAYGAAWGGNWTKLAFTAAPLSMNRDVTTFDATIEQSTLPVKRSVTDERVTFETVLAELLGDSMALVMEGTNTTTAPGASQAGYDEIKAGGQVTLTERTWGVEGKYVDASANILPVRIFIHRATATMNGALEFSKGAQVGIPIRIESLGDLAQADGEQLMVMHIVTDPGT